MYDPTSGWLQQAEGYGGFDLASAYDPTTRRVFVFGGMLSIYDVESDTWTLDNNFGFPPLWPRYAGAYDLTGVVDSRRGLFWAVGGFCRPAGGSSCEGTVFVWDIARNAAVTGDWVTTGAGFYSNRDHLQGYEDQAFESGGSTIYYANAPGFDYDSRADDLVAWPNSGAPYALDLDTKEWTLGGDVGAPVAQNAGGTFGRWRYVSAYNVFILVNSVDENVYFYKHTSGCGP